MSRSARSVIATLSMLAVFSTAASRAADAPPAAAATPPAVKGLGDPGELKSLRIEPTVDGKPIAIRSRDARQQVFVTGSYSSGQLRDLSHQVKFTSEPEGVLSIDATGLVTPLKDGDARLRV